MKKIVKILPLLIILIMIGTFCFATSSLKEEDTVTEDVSEVEEVEVADDGEVVEIVGDEESEEYDIGGDQTAFTYKDYLDSYFGEGKYNFGDAYILEENPVFEGINYGNMYVIGNNVEIKGYVFGNLFVMGKNVKIESESVVGSIFAAAESIEVSTGAEDLYAVADNILVTEDAEITRDVKVCGSEITFNGTTYGNIYSQAENLIIGDEASIERNIVYSNAVSVPEEMQSKLIKNEVGSAVKVVDDNTSKGFDVFSLLTSIATSALIVIVLTIVMPKSEKYTTDLKSRILKDTLCGLGYIVLTVLISIVLLVTVVGIPSALILLVLFIILLIFATPIASIEISKLVLGNNATTKAKIAGMAIVICAIASLLEMIPVVGAIINLILVLYGYGLAIRKLFFRNTKKEVKDNKEKVETEEPVSPETLTEENVTEEIKPEILEENNVEVVSNEEEKVEPVVTTDDKTDEPVISNEENNENNNNEE